MRRAIILLVVLACAGCATPRPPAGFAMPAADEVGAGAVLAGFLLAQGWTVRLDGSRVDATRADEHLRLQPLLDETTGLDRIIVARTWPRADRVDDELLASFALELTEVLNVGQFFAEPAGLVLQAGLPFIDELDPRLLNEFLAFTADVRLAVLQVQGDRALLAPVEDPQDSR